MKLRVVEILLFAATTAHCCCVSAAHGQSLRDEIAKQVSELETSSGVNELSTQSRNNISRKIEQQFGALTGEPGDRQEPERPPKDPAHDILDHVKVPGGVPFPEPSKVTRQKAGILLAPPNPSGSYMPVSPTIVLQPCSKSGIQREGGGGVSQSGGANAPRLASDTSKKVVFRDVIYIPKELMPDDPEEVFGSTPLVRVIESPVPAALTGWITLDQVSCLPYRVRIVGDIEYAYKGLDALKNYDSGGSPVSGRAHPWIVEAFGRFK